MKSLRALLRPQSKRRCGAAQDTKSSPQVAVINETMQKSFFPDGSSAIGRYFGFGDDAAKSAQIEVVGVVKDAKYYVITEEPQLAAYFPVAQNQSFDGNLVVPYSGGEQGVVAGVRRAIAGIDGNIAVDHMTHMQGQVDISMARC